MRLIILVGLALTRLSIFQYLQDSKAFLTKPVLLLLAAEVLKNSLYEKFLGKWQSKVTRPFAVAFASLQWVSYIHKNKNEVAFPWQQHNNQIIN